MAVDSKVNGHHRRQVAARWLPKLWRDLNEHEQALVQTAVSDLLCDPADVAMDTFLARVKRGELGMYVLPAAGDSPAAVTFFSLCKLQDGSLCFDSLVTVAIGVADRPLAKADIPAMQDLARKLGCQSMAMRVSSVGLASVLTERHGWFCSEIIMRKLLD